MIDQFNDLLRKIDRQPNLVSAAGHGMICLAWMTIGLAVAFLSTVADDTMANAVLTFFAGMCIGGYTLREADDSRKAVGGPDEGRKLGESFEDWIVPVVVTVAVAVFYASVV